VVAALAMGCWIVNSYRRPASPLGTAALQKSNPLGQPVPFAAAKPLPAASTPKPGAAKIALHRVQVGDSEVDYVSEDVTIRHFGSAPAPQRTLAGYKQVDIGEDVTVRYFATKPAGVPPARRSVPISHKTRL
jgi:hypothetical protein